MRNSPKVKHQEEISPNIVGSILERYGEVNNSSTKPSRQDLDSQILERIEDIFRNPDGIENDAQTVRNENMAMRAEEEKKEREKRIGKIYIEYLQYTTKKQIVPAMRFFQTHSEEVIEGYILFKTTDMLIFDVNSFLLLLQNKKLLRLVPKNWMDHGLMKLFFPILKKRKDVVEKCRNSIEKIAKWYPEWEALIADVEESIT